ncbi:hypothetical protein MUCCIDRAFT_107919 [Mucor lusitanicus CBS 277.49]|uniref:Uncharacterized protein n=1 Tax=Mucor lusitanicus CBS 277.49 TaxID=747725 RepID=A0A162R160_MUCCL|nr:hypothetical protein MUCCIDRAFT_107919 [Mucor lusitanicus CBS 277.49]
MSALSLVTTAQIYIALRTGGSRCGSSFNDSGILKRFEKDKVNECLHIEPLLLQFLTTNDNANSYKVIHSV